MTLFDQRSISSSGDLPRGRVVALCGGVGGAKLALGLEKALGAGQLTIAVNTGDDLELLGLKISPDLDTVLYTLGGLDDTKRGWGRAQESWNFMAALETWGGETWFSVGDRDLALHVERTRRLRAGETLTGVMGDMARRAGIRAELLPMSDETVRTIVHTSQGDLPFQQYFVKHGCTPAVRGVSFNGAEDATANPALLRALADPHLRAVVVCPSNPFLSIDPILAVPGIGTALRRTAAPVIVVSPLVGGKAVKGPTAKIMGELGLTVNSATIAAHYASLADGLVIDHGDAADAEALPLPVHVDRTLMRNEDDKRKLACAVLDFADALHEAPARARAARSAS